MKTKWTKKLVTIAFLFVLITVGMVGTAFAPEDAIVMRVAQSETALVVETLIGAGIDSTARQGLRMFDLEIIISYPELAKPLSVRVPVAKTERVGTVGFRAVAVRLVVATTVFPKSYLTATAQIIERTSDGKEVPVTPRTHTTISCIRSEAVVPKY